MQKFPLIFLELIMLCNSDEEFSDSEKGAITEIL